MRMRHSQDSALRVLLAAILKLSAQSVTLLIISGVCSIELGNVKSSPKACCMGENYESFGQFRKHSKILGNVRHHNYLTLSMAVMMAALSF